MSESRVAKCPFCGKLYKTYSMIVRDQSCCPSCERKADEEMRRQEREGATPHAHMPPKTDSNKPKHASVFWVGDRVKKIGGDYRYEGWVVAVVIKRSSAIRYVVEDDRGMLFIFSQSQLEKLNA